MRQAITIRLTDYGAVPDSGADATGPMRLALEAAARTEGPVVLECPRGRYDFYPDEAARIAYYVSNTASEEENADVTKTIGIYMKGLRDFVLDGRGSSFVFHGRMTMLALDGCERVELRRFDADFAWPTMAEMTVERSGEGEAETVVHPANRYELADGRLTWIGDGWRFRDGPMQVYDPIADRTWRVDNWVSSARAEAIGERRLRLTGAGVPKLPAGTVLQIRDGLRDQVGTFATGCRDVRWRQVSMHYMHGLGIVCQFSENLDFDGVRIVPRPGSGRTAAAFADCIHLSGCRGKVSITNGVFAGSHDDPINVHGTHLITVGRPADDELTVRFMHPQTYGFAAFHPGDDIAFVRPDTLVAYAAGKVVSAEWVSPREMRLTLAEPVPAGFRIGDAIENATWTPEVEIRGNDFSRVPTRGVLVTTRRPVVIANNRFRRLTMQAILIADDALSWYESGMATDVDIRDNEFEACGGPGMPVVQIAPENETVDAEAPVHRNIRIANNRFILNDAAALHAKSTEGLAFADNEIAADAGGDYPDGELVRLTACRKTSIANNRVLGGSGRLSVRMDAMNGEEALGWTGTEIQTTGE